MKNKEIEEILKYLKNNTYIPDETKRKYKILHRDEVNLLLSYIEQLQTTAKDCKQKLEQYENPDDLTLFYMWLDTKAKDKMTYMENQIMILKQQIQMANDIAHEKLEDYQRMKDNFDSKVDVITELKEDIEEYNDKLNEIVKERNKLINENKILKENAEHNDKVVDKVNWENKQLENNRDKAIEILGNYKHYSTPTEEQNRENEEIVDNAYNILKGGSDE